MNPIDRVNIEDLAHRFSALEMLVTETFRFAYGLQPIPCPSEATSAASATSTLGRQFFEILKAAGEQRLDRMPMPGFLPETADHYSAEMKEAWSALLLRVLAPAR